MEELQRNIATTFGDLGFADAGVMAIKMAAAVTIAEEMRKRKMSQKSLAAHLGWSRPRVSSLMRGEIDLFSVDSLNSALKPFGRAITTTYSLDEIPNHGDVVAAE